MQAKRKERRESINKPTQFLEVRGHRQDVSPSVCGLCVGYEARAWRAEGLTDHIVKWLPEFALSSAEWSIVDHANSVELIQKAARTVYQSKKFEKRGEFGELFLHAAIRQVYDSIPAISKIFYKSSVNETVKGFDAVHVVGPANDMELWLGEAKFYDNATAAIRDVIAEIQQHLEHDYLRNEFILICNKVHDSLPQAQRLKKLLSPNTSLDEIFKRICIPVLITYDSDCVGGFQECSNAYIQAFEQEIEKVHQAFSDKLPKNGLPADVRIHLFLMPLHTKSVLVAALDRKLKIWQQI